MAATLRPGALLSHDRILEPALVMPSAIASMSSMSSPAMAHPIIPHHLLLASSSSSRCAMPQWESLKGGSIVTSTGRNARALLWSSQVARVFPSFLSCELYLGQQARAALLQRSRSIHRVNRLRASSSSSSKESRGEVLHEVEEQSLPIELGRPDMSSQDGTEENIEGKDDVHSRENDRDVADFLAAREEEEGVSLKGEVEIKQGEEVSAGALKGTIIAALLLIGVVGAFGVVGFLYKEQINDILTQFSDFLEGYGPAGYALFVLAYAGLEVLAIPAVPLTMSAGLIFGTLYGTILVSMSGTLAATVAFLIARYLARDRILKLAKDNKKFLAIDKAIGEDGFRVVTLLRLSPLLPFSLGNYLYGLTSVQLGPYVLGSWLGMLPGTWAYVSAGAIGRAFIKQETEAVFPGGPEQLWTLGIGLVATIFAASYVTRLAKEAMKEIDEA